VGARRAVTIHDVAVAAGVNPSTVSRSLDPTSGAGSTKPPGSVLEAAGLLRYEPDLVAKSLRNQPYA
jgi:DNA-binding LacI/PurR family transcriptional regulator